MVDKTMIFDTKVAKEIAKFSSLSVLNGNYNVSNQTIAETFNVIGDIALDEFESELLNNNPKLSILERFDEETLLRELEVAGIKVRWEMWNDPDKFERMTTGGIGVDKNVKEVMIEMMKEILADLKTKHETTAEYM